MLGVAKFTDTGKALKDWCMEMYESNLPTTLIPPTASEAAELSKAANATYDEQLSKYVATQGFGPEAHEEPNDNTKMIT